MRTLPLADPGAPDLRSPGRFLWRVCLLQRWTLLGGIAFGVVWMAGQALVPFVLGRAIDDGVAAGDAGALLGWAAALLAIGAVQAVTGTYRHRFAVTNWLIAAFRTTQWVNGQTVRLGASLRRVVSTGEVVSVGATDTVAVARALDVSARASGAVVSFVLVAVLLLNASVVLGLVVLVGVPVFTLVIGPALRPLHGRQAAQRAELGALTDLGADTVSGLRVLRGIGGEQAFVDRYRERSQSVRAAGVRVARTQSLLDAAQVLVPGTFVVLVTWLAARFAVQGSISVGDLVAFYGYAAFLVTPLRTITEAADKFTRAFVAARRMAALLRLEPLVRDPEVPAAEPPAGVPLHDATTGLSVRPGRLTAVVCADPETTGALVDRLGRYADPGAAGEGEVTLGGIPLSRLPLDAVRRRILVLDQSPTLFSGRVRDEVGGARDGGEGHSGTAAAALHAACAEDVLEALPEGLDTALEERGRQLSGGQRQRLVLARALAADPDVLVLDEATSAVDAHTEARIAERLAALRRGRTTVLLTTSPLLLDRADEVALVVDGRVAAVGTHRALLAGDPAYRAAVLRGEPAEVRG